MRVPWRRNSLRIDIFLALFVEEFERKRAIAQNHIVKFADIELWAEFLFGLLAELHDLELAHFVSESLRGPGDVAIDFGQRNLRRVLLEKSNRLLACPAHGVNAGVDDQANGAEAFACETTKAIVGIAIQTELAAERFRIKSPAFAIGAVAVKLAELRKIGERA